MKCYLQSNEKNHPAIITRECQRALWKEALGIMRDKNDSHDHILVTGSPGIGKSRSMAFFLRMLLERGETVVYHAGKEGRFFLFKPRQGGGEDEKDEGNVLYDTMSVYGEVSPSSIAELRNSGNFFLIDPQEDMKDPIEVEAHSLLVSSPKPERYKGFADKRPTQTSKLYMPDAEKAELVAMRSILAPEGTTVKDVEGWFHDLGGRPRTIFGGVTDRARNVTKIKDDVSGMKIELLEKVIWGSAGDLESSSARKGDVPSSHLCGYQSGAPFTERKVIFVSELVEKELAKSHARKMWDKYDSLPSSFSTFKGLVFQDISLATIAKGGIFFKITRWVYQGGDNTLKEAWGQSEKSTRAFSAKVLKTELSLKGNLKVVGSLCQSFNKREALIDGSSDEGTFNSTIGEDHPNSRGGAKEATNDWGATAENKMPLYYVVPNSRYPLWSIKKKPPLFKGPKPQGWEGDDAMYAKIDFFVLEIPMTLDVMAQFKGLKIN
jgi:hypothetical protein